MSHSMNDHVRELKTILAAWLAKSNAEGSSFPSSRAARAWCTPCKSTHTFSRPTMSWCSPTATRIRCKDTLTVGRNDDGSPIEVNMQECQERSQGFKGEYLINVASYLMHVCGAQLYFVGLGADAEQMAQHMIKRRNCHVAVVRKGANIAEIHGTVRQLRGNAALTLKEPGREPQQEVIKVQLSPEAIEHLDAMAVAEIRHMEQTMSRIGVAGHKALEMPWDAESVRKAAEDVEKEMAPDFPRILTNPALTKLARAHLLWYALACVGSKGTGVVAAIISAKQYMGKRLLHPPDAALIETSAWNTYLNKTLCKWAAVGLLASEGKSDGEQVELAHMGQTVSIASPQSAKYSAPDKLTPDVIKAAVADWALALDLLEKVPLDQVGTKGGKAAGKRKLRA